MADVDPSTELADVVARLRRALRREARAAVTQEPLPVAQAELLQFLADRPGTRAGELGAALHLAPTTVSTLVGQLLDRGLLARSPDPRDGRARVLALTDTGAASLGEWQDANTRVLSAALRHLSTADRTAIGRAVPALDRLVRALGSP